MYDEGSTFDLFMMITAFVESYAFKCFIVSYGVVVRNVSQSHGRSVQDPNFDFAKIIVIFIETRDADFTFSASMQALEIITKPSSFTLFSCMIRCSQFLCPVSSVK